MYNRLWSLHGFSWILNLKYMKIILKCNISCKPQSQLMLPTERMMWILSVILSFRISQSCHTTEIQYNWSLGTRYNKNWNNWWKGIESLPQTLIFWSLYLWNQMLQTLDIQKLWIMFDQVIWVWNIKVYNIGF